MVSMFNVKETMCYSSEQICPSGEGLSYIEWGQRRGRGQDRERDVNGDGNKDGDGDGDKFWRHGRGW